VRHKHVAPPVAMSMSDHQPSLVCSDHSLGITITHVGHKSVPCVARRRAHRAHLCLSLGRGRMKKRGGSARCGKQGGLRRSVSPSTKWFQGSISPVVKVPRLDVFCFLEFLDVLLG
jgi:hypothetical protein